jgi:hypothetical protein
VSTKNHKTTTRLLCRISNIFNSWPTPFQNSNANSLAQQDNTTTRNCRNMSAAAAGVCMHTSGASVPLYISVFKSGTALPLISVIYCVRESLGSKHKHASYDHARWQPQRQAHKCPLARLWLPHVLPHRAGFVGVRVLTPEEIVEANENGKQIIVQLAFYSVFTVLLSVCALYRCHSISPQPRRCEFSLKRSTQRCTGPTNVRLPPSAANINFRVRDSVKRPPLPSSAALPHPPAPLTLSLQG